MKIELVYCSLKLKIHASHITPYLPGGLEGTDRDLPSFSSRLRASVRPFESFLFYILSILHIYDKTKSGK